MPESDRAEEEFDEETYEDKLRGEKNGIVEILVDIYEMEDVILYYALERSLQEIYKI